MYNDLHHDCKPYEHFLADQKNCISIDLRGAQVNETSMITAFGSLTLVDTVVTEMCSERDSPLEPFVLPAPGQPELARLTCGAHLGPPVLTRKQKRPRVNSLVCDRAAAFCAAGPPEALFWMSRLVTRAAKHERELARAHSQRLKQATLSLPGESVSRGFADRGALEGYPSHYTSLVVTIDGH